MGTAISFTPATGFDFINVKGKKTKILTKSQCITSMMVYENKSLEELRYEDYQLGKIKANGHGSSLYTFYPVKRTDEDSKTPGGKGAYVQSITSMKQYEASSFEELRLADYQDGRGPKFTAFTSRRPANIIGTSPQEDSNIASCSNLIENVNINIPSISKLGTASTQRQVINAKRQMTSNEHKVTTACDLKNPIKMNGDSDNPFSVSRSVHFNNNIIDLDEDVVMEDLTVNSLNNKAVKSFTKNTNFSGNRNVFATGSFQAMGSLQSFKTNNNNTIASNRVSPFTIEKYIDRPNNVIISPSVAAHGNAQRINTSESDACLTENNGYSSSRTETVSKNDVAINHINKAEINHDDISNDEISVTEKLNDKTVQDSHDNVSTLVINDESLVQTSEENANSSGSFVAGNTIITDQDIVTDNSETNNSVLSNKLDIVTNNHKNDSIKEGLSEPVNENANENNGILEHGGRTETSLNLSGDNATNVRCPVAENNNVENAPVLLNKTSDTAEAPLLKKIAQNSNNSSKDLFSVRPVSRDPNNNADYPFTVSCVIRDANNNPFGVRSATRDSNNVVNNGKIDKTTDCEIDDVIKNSQCSQKDIENWQKILENVNSFVTNLIAKENDTKMDTESETEANKQDIDESNKVKNTCYVFSADKNTDNRQKIIKPSKLGIHGKSSTAPKVSTFNTSTITNNNTKTSCPNKFPKNTPLFTKTTTFGNSGYPFINPDQTKRFTFQNEINDKSQIATLKSHLDLFNKKTIVDAPKSIFGDNVVKSNTTSSVFNPSSETKFNFSSSNNPFSSSQKTASDVFSTSTKTSFPIKQSSIYTPRTPFTPFSFAQKPLPEKAKAFTFSLGQTSSNNVSPFASTSKTCSSNTTSLCFNPPLSMTSFSAPVFTKIPSPSFKSYNNNFNNSGVDIVNYGASTSKQVSATPPHSQQNLNKKANESELEPGISKITKLNQTTSFEGNSHVSNTTASDVILPVESVSTTKVNNETKSTTTKFKGSSNSTTFKGKSLLKKSDISHKNVTPAPELVVKETSVPEENISDDDVEMNKIQDVSTSIIPTPTSSDIVTPNVASDLPVDTNITTANEDKAEPTENCKVNIPYFRHLNSKSLKPVFQTALADNPFYVTSNKSVPLKENVLKPSVLNTKPIIPKILRPGFNFVPVSDTPINMSFNLTNSLTSTNSNPSFSGPITPFNATISDKPKPSSLIKSSTAFVPRNTNQVSKKINTSNKSLNTFESISASLEQARTTETINSSVQSALIDMQALSAQLSPRNPEISRVSHNNINPQRNLFTLPQSQVINQRNANTLTGTTNEPSILNIFNREVLHSLILHKKCRSYRDLTFSNDTVNIKLINSNHKFYLFSAIPVIFKQIFAVKVTDAGVSRDVSNCVTIGFTATDPSNVNFEYLSDPDLLIEIMEYWVFERFNVRPGDEIKFMVKEDGLVEFYKNFTFFTSIRVDVAVNLWLFVVFDKNASGLCLRTNEMADLTDQEYNVPLASQAAQWRIFTPQECHIHPAPTSSHENGLFYNDNYLKYHNIVNRNYQNNQTSKKNDKPAVEDKKESDCIICCDNVIDCALYTCGHCCMCFRCGQSIMEQGDRKCPICRLNILDVMKIYKS